MKSYAHSRHERIHTKKGSQMKSQSDPDEVDDLATLEVLDEVRKATVHFDLWECENVKLK